MFLVLGLLLTIGACVIGRRAMRAALVQGNNAAGNVALIAVINSGIAIVVTAVLARLAIRAMGAGCRALMGR